MRPNPVALSAVQRSLGANVWRLRRRRGLTQAALAAQVGVEPQYLQRVELGVASPSLAVIVSLANALAVPAAKLFRPVAKLPERRPGRPRRSPRQVAGLRG